MPTARSLAHHRLVRQLSAAADVDPRTAHRALTLGIDAIHGARNKEAIVEGAASLGIVLPSSNNKAPPSAA